MKERNVEQYLIRRVRDAGGETRKVKWIGRDGAPDRLVLLRGVHFVEVKAPGEEPRGNQHREIARINDAGGSACWLDTFEKVDQFMSRVLR